MIDWKDAGQEAIEHLQALLRIDSSNPPGNEIETATYIKAVLDKEGIDSAIYESEPTRANIVARIDAGARDKALILSSHMDVVPADSEGWSHPPFGGDVADGYIWGRGAVDMKHMTAFSLMTIILAHRHKLPLKRDLVFLALADEEAGSRKGAYWMVEHHPDLLAGEYVLNEVGGFTLNLDNGARLYPIQVAEKGVAWVQMHATGTAGHGSMPHADNAVAKIAAAVQRLHTKPLPVHITPTAAAFIRNMAQILGFPAKAVLNLALMPPMTDLILKYVLPDKERAKVLSAMLHNTACPTMFKGGVKENVIPAQASATLDCRILPGQTRDMILSEVQKIVGPDVTLEVMIHNPPTETKADSPLFHILERTLKRRDPGCHVSPYMVTGFTDASAFARLGLKTYGFTPLKLPPNLVFSQLFHGKDERVPVDGFVWGLQTFYEAVTEFCTNG